MTFIITHKKIIIVSVIVLFAATVLINRHNVTNKEVRSGIYGNAMIGPTCPGPQRPGEVCSKPYQGEIVVKSQKGSIEITTFETNVNGEFKVALPSGAYVLESGSVMQFPLLHQIVEVRPDEYTQVTLDLDTGIR